MYVGIPEFLDCGRKCFTLDSGRWTLDAGLLTPDSGLWTQDPGYWTLDSGRWTLDFEQWTLDAGLWILDSGFWTRHAGLLALDPGRWTLDAEIWTLDVIFWTLSSRNCTLSLTVSEQNQNPVFDFALLDCWEFFGCESLRTSWSRLFCRDYRFWRGYFEKFNLKVLCYLQSEETWVLVLQNWYMFEKNCHLYWIESRPNILCRNLIYNFFNFGCDFCGSFSMLFREASAFCDKETLKYFLVHCTSICMSSKNGLRFLKSYIKLE